MKATFRLTFILLLVQVYNLSATVFYVSAGNPNPTPPYATWATAAPTIQNAMDLAGANDAILVTNGVYHGGLFVSKPLFLLSINGPLFTTIDGGGTNRCMTITNTTWMKGFTLTNGWSPTDGGGVWATHGSAFLTNCIFSGNCASNGGGAYDVTLYSCLLTRNCASNGSGGATYGCDLRNCTLAGNSSATGGGAYGGSLYNSILYYNSAANGSNYAQILGMTNCCTTPDPGPGAGNITNAPLFVDYAGGNLRLQAASPCINAGNNAYSYFDTSLDGNDRIYGGTIDIGAYEFNATLEGPPVVKVQPLSQTAVSGTNVIFQPVVYGAPPLSWQWWFNNAAITGATNSSLTLWSVTTNQAGDYFVVVTNALGSTTSQVAVLTVLPDIPLSFTVQPPSQTVISGTNVDFRPFAFGAYPLSWQWWFNNAAIPDETNSVLTLWSVTTNQAGDYFVVVTNSLGSATSQVAVLTVLPGIPPSITLQPLSQSLTPGGSVTFTADATGMLPLNWQWLFNGNPIPDATNSSLTLTGVTVAQSGTYSVIVTNLAGTAQSTDATLIVHVPGTKYVWQSSPNPAIPYSSWATAAHSIQDALDAGGVGDTVIVTNGLYVGGVKVNYPLSLRSVNGPQFTLIDGGRNSNDFSGSSCVSMASDASVSGFTLTNGLGFFGSGGGAFGYYGNTDILTNCLITGNRATTGGGAAGCTLYNCILTNNWGYTNGSAAANCMLYNCLLTGNSGDTNYWPAGAAFESKLYSCAITDNGDGGTDDCTLYNCTVTGNQRGGAVGGVLYNCIAYYNVSPWASAYSNYVYSTLNYCCTTPMPTDGVGNITNEPALAGDWRLSSSSACRGAGSAAYSSGLDLDGEPWLSPPSIGCDEFYSGSLTGALGVAITALWTNAPTGVYLFFDGVVTGRASDSRWEFGDGTVESNRLHTSHQWLTAGEYTVVLRAYNHDYPSGVTTALNVRVLAQSPVIHVDANSASSLPPYTNWSTAARNIKDALAAVSAPASIVLISNGIYAGGLTITTPLTLMSVNGPQFTIIDGQGTNGCVSLSTNANLVGLTLTNGSAPSGGGLGCQFATALLTNCVLVGNSGGGTYGGTLYNCILGNNSATSGGGANSAVLYNCTLTNNSGAGAVGCTLYGCKLSGNSGSPYYGAVYNCTLYDCALTGNHMGGAGWSTLYNCTLTGNEYGATGSKLYNSILYYNGVSGGASLFYNLDPATNYDSACTLNFCCTASMPINGVGNITNEPALAGAWRLSSASPCSGAGRALYSAGVDLDGEPWHNPPSIGCDEFYNGSLTGALSVAVLANWTNVPAGYNVVLDGQIVGDASSTRWEFGDGTVESNRLHTTHQWLAAGDYMVVLRAYNDDHPDGVTAATLVRVAELPIYYVNLKSPNPSAPYTSWDTAATNVQDAVSVAVAPGSLVLVDDGVYRFGGKAVNGLLTNRVAVEKPIIVRSVNGPGATVIQGYQVPGSTNGDSAVRCVYLGDGAVLSGFTLTNGATHGADDTSQGWGGGGVYCTSRAAVVTNCILVHNAASVGGGGAYGGTLYYCTLISNSSLNDGGGAFSCTLNDCILTGNRATFGGGVGNCLLNNCTVIGNSAAGDGGGAYACILNNSLVASNSASAYGGGCGAYCTLNNCSVIGNLARTSPSPGGGGVENSQLNNCIVMYNSDPNQFANTISYCCTTPMPINGVGNITNAPVFVDQTAGNFRLQPTSPCINAGNNAFVSGSMDLDGNSRIVRGTVDMGAYEFQQSGSEIALAWLQQYGFPTDGSADYADPDSDGFNNWQEWVCGTDPTNALSCLRLLSAVATSTNVTVTWQSVAGMNYFLERSTNPAASFMVLSTNIVGQAVTTSGADTNATGGGPFFYRVGVAHP